ncbi:MAG: hypothetical protein KIT11_11470 [Fimbriimonadaceae bacterium]|nr:hypothetical protein [Fimbriimonadaceae bacterium]QYK55348.1 MAG: hypothetical protein KF733_10065 [Fimbriimonadaceae bacterium]
MKALLPEVSEMIWRVVDSGDAAVINEFKLRYPELADEVEARIAMGRLIRDSRPAAVAGVFVPSLQVVRKPSVPRWALVAAVVSLAMLIIASIIFLRQEPSEPSLYDQRDKSLTKEQEALVRQKRKFSKEKQKGGDSGHGDPNGAGSGSGPGPGLPSGTTGSLAPPLQRPVTLEFDTAKLTSVISSIACQSGLNIEVAPLFQDQVVDVHYSGIPAQNVLDELGEQFAFTALPQDDRTVLIVPAREVDQSPTLVDPEPGSLGSEPRIRD